MHTINSQDAVGGRIELDYVAIHCRGVGKRFFSTVALDAVDLSIRRADVHAIVGENGAGKSTLLGILAGRVEPSSGTVAILGTELRFGDPRLSRRAGIAAVYQELMMVPALSAQANVFLGQEASRRGFLGAREMRSAFRRLCDELDVTIDPDRLARRLPVAQQQVVEIMRGMAANAQIMLLDEPTAALSERERGSILTLMRRLKQQGVTVVFVSHNLDEVLEVSDTITVLRNGRHILTQPRGSVDKAQLVRAMLGRDLASVTRARRTRSDQGVVLKATGITLPGAIAGVDVDVEAGEILGLAGLVGSGRTSVLRSLAGLEPNSTGQLWINQRPVKWPRSPAEAMRLGIAMIPEDRKTQGLVLGMSGTDNMTMARYEGVSRFGVILARRQRTIANGLADRFGIARRAIRPPVRNLSGGNQQRVLFAKWANRSPTILLADEPTRGIDVGAKAQILATLDEFAQAGMAVIMASSELEEVVAVSDRIVVLSEGRRVHEMDTHARRASVADVLQHAFRVPEA